MIIDPYTNSAHERPERPPFDAPPPAEDADALSTRLAEAHVRIEQTTREYPYQSVVAAAGLGFVLGGGLPSWAARLVVMSGARVAAARWVEALLPPPRRA